MCGVYVCVYVSYLKLWLTRCWYATITSFQFSFFHFNDCMQHPISNAHIYGNSYVRWNSVIHTHQFARLQTIIYNVICNLFIDPTLVLLERTKLFYLYRQNFCFMYESVPLQYSTAQMFTVRHALKMCNAHSWFVLFMCHQMHFLCIHITHTPASFALFLVCYAIINSLHEFSCAHKTQTNTGKCNWPTASVECSSVGGLCRSMRDSFIYYYRSSTSMNKIWIHFDFDFYNPFNNHYLNYRIDVCVCVLQRSEQSWVELRERFAVLN